MRIAFLSPFAFRLARGNERVTEQLSHQLAALGQDVTVLAWDGPRKVDFDSHVRVRRMPSLRYWESRWAVPFYAWQLVRNRIDVVNVFFAGYGEAEAIRLARRRRQLVVNFIAGFPLAQALYQFEAFKRRGLSPLLEGVIVLNEGMRAPITQYLQRPTQVIPIGVDLDFFSPDAADDSEWRAKLRIEPDEQVLLSIAALEARKGINAMIEALPALLSERRRVRYVVAGAGPERAQIEQRIAALGLQAQVNLLGAVADVRPLYQMADVFALLSEGEGLPNAMLEAMAMARPIVVSQCPPFDTCVQPEFGLTVDSHDAHSVARTVSELLRDAPRRKAMGLAGRAHASAHYAWPAIAQAYLDLFVAEAESPRHDRAPVQTKMSNE